MENFTRECLELDSTADTSTASATAKMDRVYDRAAKLLRKTLDVDGALVLDLSHFESLDIAEEDGSVSKVYQADPFEVDAGTDDVRQETYKHGLSADTAFVDRDHFGSLPPWSIMGACETESMPPQDRNKGAPSAEHAKFSDFLTNYAEGRIYEQVVPSWIRHVLPTKLQYAMSEY